MYFECFRCTVQKFPQIFKVTPKKCKMPGTLFNSITTASKLFMFTVSWMLWLFNYYLLTKDSAWAAKNLICITSIVMRGKIVRWSVTYRKKWSASWKMQNSNCVSSPIFWKQATKHRLVLWNLLRELERYPSSQQSSGMETLIRINLQSLKKCLVN